VKGKLKLYRNLHIALSSVGRAQPQPDASAALASPLLQRRDQLCAKLVDISGQLVCIDQNAVEMVDTVRKAHASRFTKHQTPR
jgi:hypothetical protein